MKKTPFWVAACFLLYACQNNASDKTAAASSADSVKPAAPPAPIEITDTSYNALGQNALDNFSKGNFDAFGSVYTDNSHLDFANGDSVVGKANILKFWQTQRAGMDSIKFTPPIFLPIKVNESKQVMGGNYLLMWYDYTLYLKKGKKLFGRAHDVIHLTADKKTDYQLHYVDNAPMMALMKMK